MNGQRHWLWAGFSLVATTLEAQSGAIRGIVVVEGSGRPIPAALVRIVGHHAFETTHGDGSFLLTGVAVGDQRLLISAIGYRAVNQVVKIVDRDTATIRVAMAESALQLEELVTTGTVSARSQRDALSPTSVVSGASLDRQLDATVAGTLRHEPGVAASGISPATAQPVIRGLSGDRVVVLQDGLRPGDLASTSADHASSIDPLNAKQIEVVRGPMSLLYGSSALGGVVNIVRDEIPTTVNDELHGAVSAQLNSVNRGGAIGGNVAGGFRRVGYRAEAAFRGAGDTRTPVGRMTNTPATTVDAGVAASLIGAEGHAGLAYRFYQNDYGIPGGFVGGHPTGVDITMVRHSLRGSAEVHRDRGRWESAQVDAGLTFYRHRELESSGSVGTRFRQTFATVNVLAKHRGWLGATSGALGLVGQYRYIQTGGTLRTPTTADVSAAAFVVQEYGQGPLRMQGGLRLDLARYEPKRSGALVIGSERVPILPRSFHSFSGSLGALYDLGGGFRLGANAARAYRTPDFNELYSNGPHLAANSFDVGDPRLEAETGIGLDAFARLERSRLRVEVAAFQYRLSNYIFPSSRGRALLGRVGGRPLFQYTNEDARFTGTELAFTLGITERLVAEATASYVAARFTSARTPIPIIEPPDTSFVEASRYPPLIPPWFGHLEVRYERPTAFAGLGVRWAARQRRLGDFETTTSGYLVPDVHLGVRLLVGGQYHTVTLRVDNATDREYRDHLSRIKEILPQPGRNVSVLYRVLF